MTTTTTKESLPSVTNEESDEKEQQSFRSVSRIINSIKPTEGGGFVENRPFPTNALLDFDPFLLLDEMGPKNWKPGEAKGAPEHPHRGFETVTYMLEGRLEHKDSRGNSGLDRVMCSG